MSANPPPAYTLQPAHADDFEALLALRLRVDDGLIAGIDEYWATAEEPPAWREALPGRSRFDAGDDARARRP